MAIASSLKGAVMVGCDGRGQQNEQQRLSKQMVPTELCVCAVRIQYSGIYLHSRLYRVATIIILTPEAPTCGNAQFLKLETIKNSNKNIEKRQLIKCLEITVLIIIIFLVFLFLLFVLF